MTTQRKRPPTRQQLDQKNRRAREKRRNNPEAFRRYTNDRYSANSRIREQKREYAKRTREHRRAYQREYYLRNRDAARDRVRCWQAANRDHIKEYHRNRRPTVTVQLRVRRQTDPSYRVLYNLRSRLAALVRKTKASRGFGVTTARTLTLLGCSTSDFIIYLESRFEQGMTWENHGVGVGKWQIDHIMPCAIFDLTKPEHQRRCFHFSNLQPLWASENARKSDRFHPAQVEVAKSWL